MASAGGFPDVLREGDPLLGNSYQHYYEGAYYRLLWPDWPDGYRRDVLPAVYSISADKAVNTKVADEALVKAVEQDYWRRIDYAMAHPVPDGPGPDFLRDLRAFAEKNPSPTVPGLDLSALARQQKRWADGMADGPSMTAESPKTALVPDPWNCPRCGAAGNTGRFCPECGSPRPQKPGEWRCPSCGMEGNSGNFCAGCGAKKPG